jgi:hypothetical protein
MLSLVHACVGYRMSSHEKCIPNFFVVLFDHVVFSLIWVFSLHALGVFVACRIVLSTGWVGISGLGFDPLCKLLDTMHEARVTPSNTRSGMFLPTANTNQRIGEAPMLSGDVSCRVLWCCWLGAVVRGQLKFLSR